MTPKSNLTIAISAALLSAALIALLINQTSEKIGESGNQAVNVKPEEVLTFDCEIPVHKPDYITLTCADGGIAVGEIKWQSWEVKAAKGTGVYAENNCQPDCASGKLIKTPVVLSLTNLIEYKSKFYLKDLAITTQKGNNSISRLSVIKIDLSEYAN
jgi:hypothetical protein